MSDAGGIVALLPVAGLGYVLVIAAGQFASGLKAAKAEHDTRLVARKGAGSDGRGERRHQEQEGKAEALPRGESPRPRPWHEVLEVAPAASLDEIKAAYRRMIALYHPDRVAGLGAELRRLAELRAKEINAAYASARDLRGA